MTIHFYNRENKEHPMVKGFRKGFININGHKLDANIPESEYQKMLKNAKDPKERAILKSFPKVSL